MKIPFDELIQDVRGELISSGFKSTSPELDKLHDVESMDELVAFLMRATEMEKEEAFEFIFDLCVEAE